MPWGAEMVVSHSGPVMWVREDGAQGRVEAQVSAPDDRVSQLDVAPRMSRWQSWHLAWLILSYLEPATPVGFKELG